MKRRDGGEPRFAMRLIRYTRAALRGPGAVAIALLVACGIGACMTVFALVRSTLLADPPFPEARRLLVVRKTTPEGMQIVFDAEFMAWAEHAGRAATLAAYALERHDVTGDAPAERARVARVTAGAFAVFGWRVVLGRALDARDMQAGADPVVVVTRSLGERLFVGQATPLGARLALDRVPHTVVGVVDEAALPFRARADVVVPWRLSGAPPADRPVLFVSDIVARPHTGTSPERLSAILAAIDRQALESLPVPLRRTVEPGRLVLEPLKSAQGARAREPLKALMLAVGALLWVACANIASLQATRAIAREGEIAVKLSLGAGRGRVLRERCQESLPLGVVGGLLATLLALAATRLLPGLVELSGYGVAPPVVDGVVIAAGVGAALLCTSLFSVAPLVFRRRLDLAAHLRAEGARVGTVRARGLAYSLLAGIQVAVAVVLVTACALLSLSYHRLSRVSTGFRSRDIVTGGLALPAARYPDVDSRRRFVEQVTEALGRLPGADAAALAGAPPMAVVARLPVEVAGAGASSRPIGAALDAVSAAYFSALGIPLLSGGAFPPHDTAGAHAAIVNERFARLATGSIDVVGLRIRLRGEDWIPVVGVAGNVRALGAAADAEPRVYLALTQSPSARLSVFVRARPGVVTADQLRAAVGAIDKDVPVFDVAPLDSLVDRALAPERLGALISVAVSGLALLIAMGGAYGVTAHVTARRRYEIGIRLALGARPADIFWSALGGALRRATWAVAAGLLLAAAAISAARHVVHGLGAFDPWVGAGVALGVLGASLAASAWPVARATAVDPATTLRST